MSAIAWSRKHLHVVIPVLVYVVLSLVGVSQSSIGIETMRQDGAASPVSMIGIPRALRTDEYLTSTPLNLGVLATGETRSRDPLSEGGGFLVSLPAGAASSIPFFDGAAMQLGPWLPDSVLFAARWWLPFLLLFLAAPAFFEQVVGRRSLGLFAATLITLNPASAWWSFSPVQIFGWTFAAAASLLLASKACSEGRGWRSAVWAGAAIVFLARLPFLYQPWIVMIAPPLLLGALVHVAMATPREARRRVAVVWGATALGAAGLFAASVVDNWQALTSLSGTTYPGRRVAVGDPSPPQKLFAATSLGTLVTTGKLRGTNESEISSAYTVLLPCSLVALAWFAKFRSRAARWTTYVVTAATCFWALWVMVDFGGAAAHVPLLNIVVTHRAADMIGFLAIIVFCLVLSALPDRGPRVATVVVAGVAVVLSVWGGLALRAHNIPTASVTNVVLSSVLAGVAVLLIVGRPRRPAGYVVAGVLSLSLVVFVNPVLLGMGDMRASDTARRLLAEGHAARQDGSLWVSDDIFVDSLMQATGVPALSGRQLAGPDPAAWRRLLPHTDSHVWNRGGSFVKFRWGRAATVSATNPRPDSILVTASPCALARLEPRLRHLVSGHALRADCLTPSEPFTWGGRTQYVYDVHR